MFDAFYRRYFARVYRYLLARTATPLAADLAQQVFLQALDALPRYRDRGLRFDSWLLRTARHTAANSHRRAPIPWDCLPEPLRGVAVQGPDMTVPQQEPLNYRGGGVLGVGHLVNAPECRKAGAFAGNWSIPWATR